jgi:signal transduction histidine kinase
MTPDLRKTGIDVIGDMAWGTHFCLFYETKADLLEPLAAYCRAGLEGQEFCLWVVAAPATEEEAWHALRLQVADLDRYVADGGIEVVAARDWYLQDGVFDLARVIRGWNEKLARALARGYAGIRVTGDTVWLEKKDWKDFCEYEASINDAFAHQHLAALCTYPLAACGAGEILDVVCTHQFALARRRGNWDVIETAGYKRAKAEITRLNEELEQRVVDRTQQLLIVNEELRKEVLERHRAEAQAQAQAERLRQVRADLAHVSRVTTMGEMAASIAHEVDQPLSGVVINANACLRFLAGGSPNLDEVREGLQAIARDGRRASEVTGRVRSLARRAPIQRQPLDVNMMIREVLALAEGEVRRARASVRTELAGDLPRVHGDPVQLQQVVLNLVLNGLDAMTAVVDRPRELVISANGEAVNRVRVAVRDSGAGIDPEAATRMFDAFYTTKPGGMGMGLLISRTIIEQHGGGLWAVPNEGPGTTFYFTV